MMVNKENIEFKIFEYHEGLLSPQEQLDLLNFIKVHPEYQIDFDAMEKSYLKDEELVYQHVDELLMPEQQNGKSIFNWRLSLGVFLISLLSYGIYKKININDDLNSSNNEVNTIATQNINNNKYPQNNNLNYNNTSPTSISKEVTKNIANSVNTNPAIIALQKNPLRNVIQLAANNLNITSNENVNAIESNGNSNQIHFYKLLNIADKNLNKSFNLSELQLLRKKLKYKEPQDKSTKFINSKDPFYANEEGTYLSLNPSFAGNTEGVRVEYYYRTEWPQINSGNYITQLVTIDGYIKPLKGGVGMLYESDVIGHNSFNTRTIALFYSPKIKLSNKLSIEPSIKWSNTNRSIQWKQLNEFMLIDPRDGFTHVQSNSEINELSTSSIRFNTIGTGILINHQNFFIGASIDKLNDVNYNFDNLSQTISLPNLISGQAGTEIKPNKESSWTIVPSINYVRFGEWERFWLNNQIKYKKLMLGGGLAHNKAFIANFGYIDRIVRLVYSYGLSQPPLGLNNYYGSHQISLRINFLPVK